MELKLGIIGFCLPFIFLIIVAIVNEIKYHPPKDCDSLITFEQFLNSYQKNKKTFISLEKDCVIKEGWTGIIKYGFTSTADFKEYQKFKKNLSTYETSEELEKLAAEAQKWEDTFNEFMKENKDLVDKVAIIAAKNGIDSMVFKENKG